MMNKKGSKLGTTGQQAYFQRDRDGKEDNREWKIQKREGIYCRNYEKRGGEEGWRYYNERAKITKDDTDASMDC